LKQNNSGTFFSSNISNVDFDANNFTISNKSNNAGGNLTVYGKTIFGAISTNVNGQKYTNEGIATDDNGIALDYELFVGGKVTIQRSFVTSEDIEFKGSLTINGTSIINGGLLVNGSATFDNGLTVANLVTLNDSLTVNGTTAFNKGLTVNGAVATLNNGLTAYGSITLNNGLTVYGSTILNKGLTVNGAATTLNNGLTVNGAASVTGDMSASSATFNKGLTVNGAATTLNNGLTVTSNGTATIDGAMTVSGGTATGAAANNTVISGAKIWVGNSGTTINGGEISCTSVTTTSSRTKKNSIVHSERKAVKAINDIEIVDFFYNSDKGKTEPKVGFIAEDTDSLFSTNKKDCMDHSNCIGMLLKAIQELSAEIEELKKNR
jgi:hypothetical protein